VVDEDILNAACDGDADALRTLYERYATEITRRLTHMTGDEEIARDLTQDTFVTAFSRLGRFRGDARFSTWLHAIAFNHLRDHRKRMRRKLSAWERFARRPSVAPPSPDQTLEHRDELARMQRALEQLPAPQRDAFVLRVVEQLSLEEAAMILRARPATISYRARRAEAHMRELFEELEPQS